VIVHIFPAYPPNEGRCGGRRDRASYASRIDVRITPEPTEAERALIEAALDGTRDAAEPDAWMRAALEEGVVAGVEPAHETEPTL
jgi:hypothetical protein